jgi:branched-chain amino acid transport system permease protein
MVLSYAIALVGLNILTGYNGQISLGHGAFFALGAYAAGMLIEHAGMPYWLTVPSAGLICLVLGYLFGRPALKLEGLYLALATFALGVAMPQLLKYKALEPWTGGVQGIILMKPDAPFGIKLNADQWVYIFALIVAIVMFWLARNMINSSTGRALRAVRDHAMAAQAMGVDNAHYKSMAFGVSAAYTGVGGALSAIAVQYVSPDSFNLFLSISLLVGIVVGGIGTLWGALFGAVFIMFVPSLAESISKAAPWAIYGVVLILLMFLMPGGVVGLFNKLTGRRSA